MVGVTASMLRVDNSKRRIYRITEPQFLKENGFSLVAVQNWHCSECNGQAEYVLFDPSEGRFEPYCESHGSVHWMIDRLEGRHE